MHRLLVLLTISAAISFLGCMVYGPLAIFSYLIVPELGPVAVREKILVGSVVFACFLALVLVPFFSMRSWRFLRCRGNIAALVYAILANFPYLFPGALYLPLLAYEIQLSPNLSRIANWVDRWQGKGQPFPHEVKRLHMRYDIYALAWNSSGTRLAALGEKLTVFDTASWEIVMQTGPVYASCVGQCIAFLPDGSIVTPANKNTDDSYSSLTIWDPTTGAPIRQIPGPGNHDEHPRNETNKIALSQEGHLAVTMPWRRESPSAGGSYLYLFDVADWTSIRKIPIPENPTSFIFAKKTNSLIVGSGRGNIFFINLNSGAIERSFQAFPSGRYVEDLAISQNDELIAAGAFVDGRDQSPNDGLRIWRVTDGHAVATLPGTVGSVSQIAWSSDGDVLIAKDLVDLRSWANLGSPSPPIDLV